MEAADAEGADGGLLASRNPTIRRVSESIGFRPVRPHEFVFSHGDLVSWNETWLGRSGGSHDLVWIVGDVWTFGQRSSSSSSARAPTPSKLQLGQDSDWSPKPLGLRGRRIRQHELTETIYDGLADPTDYTAREREEPAGERAQKHRA